MTGAERYFLEIVRCGSLNRAAAQLFVSQPSLSKYIQRLEKQLGIALFDRSTSPMRLNDAGRLYYQHLLEQEEREQLLRSRLGQIEQMERGTLRLGMPSFCAQCYLPKVLQAFQSRYPAVNTELLEASGEQLENALLEQRIDLAVLHLPITHPELKHERLFSERVLLAVPGQGGQILEGDFEAFRKMPFILPLAEQKLGRFTSDFFASQDHNPQVYLHTQNVTTMLSLAALGMGAVFVPEGGLSSISQSILDKLTFYHLRQLENKKMELAVLRRRSSQLPAYTETFIDLLRNK